MTRCKKIFSVLLSTLIVISCTATVAFAQDITDTDTLLRQKGFPQYVLDELNDITKEKALASGGTFDSSVLDYYDENMELQQKLVFRAGKPTIIPFGTISNTAMTFQLTALNLSNGNRLVLVSYTWNILPLNRWIDELGIQWDSSKWTAVEDTFWQDNQYDIQYNNGTIVENISSNSSNNPQESSTSGVIWDADLKASSSQFAVTALYGAGGVTITPTSSTISSLHATYVHKKITIGSVSLGFGPIGLSISGPSSGYDSVSTYINI